MELEKVTLEFLDKNKVRFTCRYPVSKERLWKAISDTKELNLWFMKTEWDFQVGGKFNFEEGWDGWIEELSEFEHIQLNSAKDAFTRFDIKPVETATELHLTDQIPKDLTAPSEDSIYNIQPGGKGTHWVGLLAGWHDFLLALDNHLAHKEIQDFFYDFSLKYKNLLEQKYR